MRNIKLRAVAVTAIELCIALAGASLLVLIVELTSQYMTRTQLILVVATVFIVYAISSLYAINLQSLKFKEKPQDKS